MLFQAFHSISILPTFVPDLIAAPSAYIDPTSGGMLFQVLAVLFALFSGVGLFFSRQIKTTFNRVKRYLRDFRKPEG